MSSEEVARSPITSDRLLEVAASLFREHGYARTTTRQIAERLGIRKASLYHHISGKEDLLLKVCDESLSHITEAVGTAAKSGPPESRLRAMIDAHLASAVEERDLHATMLLELGALSADRRDEVVGKRDLYESMLRDAIVADQEAGRLRSDVDPRLLTLALLNMLNWTIFWFDPAGELDVGQLSELLATLFLDGASPRSD